VEIGVRAKEVLVEALDLRQLVGLFLWESVVNGDSA
jgi:hypothetical protein